MYGEIPYPVGQSPYGEIKCIMGTGHMEPPEHRQNDRKTLLNARLYANTYSLGGEPTQLINKYPPERQPQLTLMSLT